MNAVVMDDAVVGAVRSSARSASSRARCRSPNARSSSGNPARIIKDVTDEMLAWKTAGTGLYQALPRPCAQDGTPSSRSARSRPTGRPRRECSRPGTKRPRACRGGENDVRKLQSYAQGTWVEGTGKGTTLHHAVTGEPMARRRSDGIDFKGMLEYGRTHRRAALRQMTFHARARMLKAMAQYLMSQEGRILRDLGRHRRHEERLLGGHRGRHRDLLHLCQQGTPGASRRDLLRRWHARAALQGRHLRRPPHRVPLEGVAVHINAYNFPCWGMLEKLAPTFLAGMPAIVKPATVTLVPDREDGPCHDRVGDPAGGLAPADLRRRRATSSST